MAIYTQVFVKLLHSATFHVSINCPGLNCKSLLNSVCSLLFGRRQKQGCLSPSWHLEGLPSRLVCVLFHAFLRRRADKESYGLFSFLGSPLTGQSCRTLFWNTLKLNCAQRGVTAASHGHHMRDFCHSLNTCIGYIDPSSQKIRFFCSFIRPSPRPQKRESERGKKGWLRCSTSESGSYFTNKAMVCLAKEMLDFRLQAKTVVSQASTRKYRATFSQEYNDQVKNTLFFREYKANRCDYDLCERKPPRCSTLGLDIWPFSDFQPRHSETQLALAQKCLGSSNSLNVASFV